MAKAENSNRILFAMLAMMFLFMHGESYLSPDSACAQSIPTGCAATGAGYSATTGNFDSTALDMVSSSVNSNGNLVLDTGNSALDINNIVVPFEQDVASTFLLEGAGYRSDLGWFVKQEAETKLGYTITGTLNFNDLVSAGVTINYLYRTVEDDQETSGCCGGGNGILDTYYNSSDLYLGSSSRLTEDILTGWGFTPDSSSISGFVNAGDVDPRDMRKQMGVLAAGTEIVYFIHADGDISGKTFYSKDNWSADTWNPSDSGKRNATIIFDLSIASPEQGGPATTYDTSVTPNTATQGFVPIAARDRLGNPDGKTGYPTGGYFNVGFNGTVSKSVTRGSKFNHFVVAAPANDPFKWVIGAEDLIGGGDADFNDMVFMIERKTGGSARLNSTNALTPPDASAYITSATLKVEDKMPCTGKTSITYSLSVDNGTNWTSIEDYEWSVWTNSGKGTSVTNWVPGTPEATYREATVNFTELNLTGRELVWRAEMVSEDETCVPEISMIDLSYSAAINAEFSRSSPVVLGNVIYSSSFETPAASWPSAERYLRGHVRSQTTYDPLHPQDGTGFSIVENWDGGQVLSSSAPSGRNILTPSVTYTQVVGESVGTGDGTATTFTGTLANHPVVHSTISITDNTETFTDQSTSDLVGSLTGTGTIDKYTGVYSVTFNSAPGNGQPITVDYTAYSASTTLVPFNSTAITATDMALDDSQITDDTGTHYVYDFNNNGSPPSADTGDANWLKNWTVGYVDGNSTAKAWPLYAIDHSAPALVGAPGVPSWYYGSDVSKGEQDSWDIFRCEQRYRKTVAYVGSRGGMLHSFEAGAYRPYYVDTTIFGTNDSCTSGAIDTFKSAINANGEIYPSPGGDIISKRGYYEWSGGGPNYGDGKEIFAFIPINLIAQLKNNALDELDQAYVDASPSVAHVRFVDGTWHTIVITAEGNGGDSVFALDVTDPDNPKYLWEFTDPDLMRSRSSPSIGVVFRLQKASGPAWAVAFVSGINNDPTKYPSIYIVNAETGELDQRVYLDSATDGAGGTPSGQPAVLDSDGNGYVDRLYIGTDKGYMYKINMPDSGSSSTTTVCTFYDAGQPIYASPAVTIKNTVNSAGEIDYRAIVLFGTGDSPYQNDATTSQYYFYAIEDKDNKSTCSTGSQLWNKALPAGERVFASAAATAGRVYFGTSTAETEDPCAAPVAAAGGAYGNFYAMNVETGAEVFSQSVGNVTTTPVVNDEHVYIKTSDGKMSGFGGDTFQNEVPKGGSSQAKVSIWREIN